jgi:glyoxylase-like metal-dependent hydrolase (beta-lactamase superfamily II)
VRDLFFVTSGAFVAPSLFVEPPSLHAARHLTRVTTLSNTVAVVVHDDDGVTLIDAGLSRAACDDPVGVLGQVRARMMGIRARRGDAVVDQLEALGIDRARVRTIVATHLHLDHIGAAVDFPNAEVVSSDVELSAFRTLGPPAGYRGEDLARSGRLRPIHVSGAPTYGFPASHDLFGDGEVILLDAHGHTPGMLAVALRSHQRAERCYVHIGDAVYQSWEYALAPAGPSLLARGTAWRRDLMRETYAFVRACEADPRRPILVPSHDQAVFKTLPHAPSGASSAESARVRAS